MSMHDGLAHGEVKYLTYQLIPRKGTDTRLRQIPFVGPPSMFLERTALPNGVKQNLLDHGTARFLVNGCWHVLTFELEKRTENWGTNVK